jgi:DNA-binding NarL/FixJ family response regulator
LSPNPRDEARRLAEAAYLGADITGELVNASKLLDDARRADPNLTASLHAAAAAAYMIVNGDGTVDTAFQLLLGAIETGDHGWRGDNDELAEALSTLLLLCWWAGREDYWERFYAAVGRLRPEPAELLLVQSRVFPDTARSTPEDREHLRELIAKQREEFEPNRIIRVNTSSVYADLLYGCRPSAWRLVEDGRHGGAVRSSLGAYMHLCLDDYSSGRWQEGQQLADEAITVCREHGYNFIIWYFLLHEALFAAGRGEVAAAYEWADELSRVAALRNAKGTERIGFHARTVAAVAAGDWESAYRFATQMSPAGELARYSPHAMWVAFDLVEAAMRTGREDEARAHARALVAADVAAISPRMRLVSLGVQALVTEGEEAFGLFEDAVRTPGAGRFPFDLARVQLAYGERLRRNLNSVRAREVLHEALAAFESMGAVPWANRTKDELRAARDPNSRALLTPDAIQLTPQEQAIAELAAEGMSNKQIAERLYLSPRTVSGHLYRVFPKLGITSRAALRDALLTVADPREADSPR